MPKKRYLSHAQQVKRDSALRHRQRLLDRGITIPWPKSRSEFELSTFLYHRLKELGHLVRGNVVDAWGHFLDLVVFDKKHRPLCLIEVKKHLDLKTFPTDKICAIHRQITTYRAAKVPVCLVVGWPRARQFLKEIAANGLPTVDWHCDEFDAYLAFVEEQRCH